jgi:hypothetical protein
VARERKVRLEDLARVAARTRARVHAPRLGVAGRVEALVEDGVLGGQRADRGRVERALPVVVDGAAVGQEPLARRAEGAVVRIREIRDPGRHLRVVQPVGQGIRQQAALQERLGAEAELAPAVRHRRDQLPALGLVPHEALQERDEARVVQPIQRNRLDRDLVRLGVERDAHLERRPAAAVVEAQILPAQSVRIAAPLALDLGERTARITLPAQLAVRRNDALRELLLLREHALVAEETVFVALARVLAPAPDRLAVREGRLEPDPGVGERLGVGATAVGQPLEQRLGFGGDRRDSRRRPVLRAHAETGGLGVVRAFARATPSILSTPFGSCLCISPRVDGFRARRTSHRSDS